MNPLFSTPHLILAGGLLVAAGAVLAWRTARRCGRRRRITIVVCRAVGLLALVGLALNPGSWEVLQGEHRDEFAVLVDHSRSMATEDVDGDSRWNAARRLAADAVDAAESAPVDVQLYAFADDLSAKTPEALETIAADGETTRIVRNGNALLARYRAGSKRLAGIILLSDGRLAGARPQTDLGLQARAAECPIYPVPLGGRVRSRDLAVAPARREHVSFLGQESAIAAVVRNTAMGRVKTTVELLDRDGKVLAAQDVEVKDGEQVRIPFQLKHERAGFQRYTLKLAPRPGETTSVNNEAGVGVLVLDTKLRVFMAEGTPSWDSKFMAQMLRHQPNIEVCNVYRISRDRFFRVETDARQVSGTDKSNFPDSAADLAGYDLIIFGKGADYFLNAKRVNLLRQFVRDRGGSVLFFRGKPYSGEFPELESLEPVVWGDRMTGKFRFVPSSDGQEIGLFGRLLPAPDEPIWTRLPALQFSHRCREVKGFSQVLANGRAVGAGGRRVPLIISRRFGKGIVVSMNAEDFWHWDFFPKVSEASDIYRELWTQLIQWAATYSEYLPGQEFSLRLDRQAVFPGDPVQARVGRRFISDAECVPAVRLTRRDMEPQVRPVSGPPDANGGWEMVFSLTAPGVYQVELVDQRDGKPLGPCTGLQILPLPTESTDLSADRDFLKTIAVNSGARLLQPEDVPAVIREFRPEQQETDLTKATWNPAWDHPLVLLAILLGFGLEWFVRRRNGML